MKIKLHYNQFSSGGAVDREKWSLISQDEMNYDPFWSCETLRTVEIEIPDTWEVDKERDMIFDERGYSTCYQELSKNWDKITVGTYKFPYYKTI